MTQKKRLLGVLRGESAPLAWYADLSWWYESQRIKGTLDPRYGGEEGYLAFHRDVGAGICFYAPFLWRTTYDSRHEFGVETRGPDQICTWKTPRGQVRQVSRHLPGSFTWAITEHFVKTLEDLAILLEIQQYAHHEENYGAYLEAAKLWGEDGVAVGLTPLGTEPFQRLVTRWAGIETTVGLYMEDRAEFESMLELLREADEPIWRIIEDSPCEVLEMPDNFSSEVTGQNFFRRYLMPQYQKLNRRLHSAKKITGIHNDGTLGSTFGLMGECGFDFVEAVTPSPVGDIAVDGLRARAGEEIVVWGGLPGALFSPLFDEDSFERHLRHTVEVFARDGRCVLGVADQVPPDAVPHRVKRVAEAVNAIYG